MAVDLRAAAAVAQVRVHRVGEVDRRRTGRQVDDLALRRQHVDRVGEQRLLERREPLARVGDRVLPVEHLPQPRDAVLEPRIVPGRRALLVAPVGGDAVLGVLVHLAGADLHLERLPLRPDHRGVQRAVVVRLRLRDVVVELAGQRRPQVVHDAERRVARLHVVDDDAHRADVVERLDARLLAAHLAPDAEDVLGPAAHVGPDPRRGELALERRDHVLDVALAVEPALVDQLRDLPVGLRLDRAERQVLELPLELPDAEPVRERRVEVEHLARGLAPQRLVRRHEPAERREPLGELEDHDPDVLDHREQHLAEVLRLRRALLRRRADAARPDRVHARDAGDEPRHVVAEARGDLGGVERTAARQHGEQRAADRRRIQLQPRDDACDPESAVDELLAVGAGLVAGAGERPVERLAEALDRVARVGPGERVEPRGDGLRRGGSGLGVDDGDHDSIIIPTR